MTQDHRSTMQSDEPSERRSTGAGTDPGRSAGPRASEREALARPDASAESAAAAQQAARDEPAAPDSSGGPDAPGRPAPAAHGGHSAGVIGASASHEGDAPGRADAHDWADAPGPAAARDGADRRGGPAGRDGADVSGRSAAHGSAEAPGRPLVRAEAGAIGGPASHGADALGRAPVHEGAGTHGRPSAPEGAEADRFVRSVSLDATAVLSRPPVVLPPPRPLGEIRLWPRPFLDRLTAPLPGIKAIARFAREGALRPRPAGLADIPRLPFEPGPLPVVDAGTVALTWAGHASWVIRIGGLTVLTDPVWSRKILGTPARITPVGVAWDALPPVDAVVISHNHYDHLDAPTIARLPRDTPLFVPAGLARWFRRRRFTRVTELDWWEAAETGGVRFDFVPAHHWSKRRLNDTCRSLWGGWVLTDPAGQRVYFAGDTGYGHWFSRIGHRYPGIDVALLPIGAYDPRWWLRDVHCNPEEAVQAARDLGARRMAPMHWATFMLSAEPVMEPLMRVRTAWEKAGLPREDLWDLPVGGSRVLEGAALRPVEA